MWRKKSAFCMLKNNVTDEKGNGIMCSRRGLFTYTNDRHLICYLGGHLVNMNNIGAIHYTYTDGYYNFYIIIKNICCLPDSTTLK